MNTTDTLYPWQPMRTASASRLASSPEEMSSIRGTALLNTREDLWVFLGVVMRPLVLLNLPRVLMPAERVLSSSSIELDAYSTE